MIARQFNTNHHKVKDILTKNNIIITQKNRIREPFTQEHKNKILLVFFEFYIFDICCEAKLTYDFALKVVPYYYFIKRKFWIFSTTD